MFIALKVVFVKHDYSIVVDELLDYGYLNEGRKVWFDMYFGTPVIVLNPIFWTTSNLFQ